MAALRFAPALAPIAPRAKARRCGRARKGLKGRHGEQRSPPGNGPSQRQLRVGELIRRTLSDVLNRAEIHDPDLNAMSITVGEVSVSADLKVATVYVMPLMGSVPVRGCDHRPGPQQGRTAPPRGVAN